MRRSAAPSFRADAKRPCFIPQMFQNVTHKDKENTCHVNLDPSLSTAYLNDEVSSSVRITDIHTHLFKQPEGIKIRTNEDILDLILDDDTAAVNNNTEIEVCTEIETTVSKKNFAVNKPKLPQGFKLLAPTPLPQDKISENEIKTLSNCIFCLKDIEEASLFNVLWCKRSGKKHKTWEGDGLLVVRNRSAILKDLAGKVLDRGLGYKLKEVESLEDGSKFYIGGKECERIYNKESLPVVDVYVDSFLTKQLRSHQKEGVSFMYRCIMGFQHDFGQGVILADEMGLGKTLQCIALIWTLYRRGPYKGLPILKRVIIITPSSLVTNWQNEFHKWLGKTRMSIFAVNQKNTVKDYMKSPKAVLIISYEMFLRSAQLLSSMTFDLVICDEGHRIKNLNIKVSNVVNCLSTTRRILLTGTPIQNDLAEFFSIVDFVNPGALGSIQYFRRNFEKPIAQSRNQECSETEKEYGEDRNEELGNITKMFMLRRTQEVINQYLPPKTETIVFCRPSEMQSNLYRHLLKSRTFVNILSSAVFDTSTPLVCISLLRKLCNHPSLLYKNKITEEDSSDGSVLEYMESVFPANYKILPTDSGKMKVLESMLTSLFTHNLKKEKVVVVSAFTKTLDILEVLFKLKRYEYLRLDGSTNTASRQEIVDVFNCSYTKYSIFLLSSKAGGVGFNLVGASRIILYDIDWNPANDLQAMSRIWRDGQKHEVYVYRLLTTGTIEEKMFQRQLSKQCLSGSVLEANSAGKLRFSKEELMDLFTFHEQTRCITHDLISCKCLSLEYILNIDELEDIECNSKEQVKNVGMAELMNWTHICGPISNENCSDFCLVNGGRDITFLFQNAVNTGKKP